MKYFTVTLFIVLVGFMIAVAQENTRDSAMTELTGVYSWDVKKTVEPVLTLDGSQQIVGIKGTGLRQVQSKDGTRLRVKGVLKSYLFNWDGSNKADAPPPLRKGWIVYLDVIEAKIINEPFGN